MYDIKLADQISERMKKQWQDPAYRARMVEATRNRKRCRDCKHIGVKGSESWLECGVFRHKNYLTGGEFACARFEERDEKV